MRKPLPFDPDPVMVVYDLADLLHRKYHEYRLNRLLRDHRALLTHRQQEQEAFLAGLRQPSPLQIFAPDFHQQVATRVAAVTEQLLQTIKRRREQAYLEQYPNLWFDVDDAQAFAQNAIEARALEAKSHLLDLAVWLTKTGQKRTLRELGRMVGIAASTVLNYLVNFGAMVGGAGISRIAQAQQVIRAEIQRLDTARLARLDELQQRRRAIVLDYHATQLATP